MPTNVAERTILKSFALHRRRAGEPMPMSVLFEDCRPASVARTEAEAILNDMAARELVELGPGNSVRLTAKGQSALAR